MAEDRITTLYTWSEAMTSAGNEVKEKHENEYKTIIEYVKSSETKERILAAQLIARFFKYFPDHEETAFDAIVDLCESANVDVRKHATMVMIQICRDCKHLVSKAADILIQLYQTDQASEVNLINQSLTTLLNLNIQKFLQSFFTNFEDGTEVVRERALKFLSTKIHTVGDEILTKDIEEQLLTYSKKALEDVTKDEFITFISILTKLKIAKSATGQAMIVAVIKSQAELDKDFDFNDKDTLDKFLLCTKHSIPLLTQYHRGSEYINYICLKILPHLKELVASGNDLNILQALAEMSPHIILTDAPELIDLQKCQRIVFDKLIEYLPLPQSEVAVSAEVAKPEEPAKTETAGGDTIAEKTTETKEPAGEEQQEEQPQQEEQSQQEQQPQQQEQQQPQKVQQPSVAPIKQEVDFQFTHIEYLLYTFHQFGRLAPEFFDESLQNECKLRLGHLVIGCTKYMDILAAQLKNVKSDDLKKEENRLRSIALRTTKNISILVKDLFKKPPQFKPSVVLSCKPLAGRETNPVSNNNVNNNNNSNNKNSNNGNYNKQHFNRQAGHKNKFRQSYTNDRNKKPRYNR